MPEADEKQTLHRYLQDARQVLLWKLDGLSDYDIRRPITPTGTNLLGLVKHCAGTECVYFGRVTRRPFSGEAGLDWHEGDDSELSGHMYATGAESRELVTDFYRRVWAHSDTVITELPLDARVTVRWWPEEAGAAGFSESASDMPPETGAAWQQHRDKLEGIARTHLAQR